MAELKDKIQTTLDESRMLILGSQVLLGFQFRSAFEKGFEQLPEHAQYLKLAGLALMLVAVCLLILPSADHRITEEGEDTQEFHRFATRVMLWALLPFAVGLGLDFYVAGEKLAGETMGLVGGAAASLFAFFFWYGLEVMRRGEHAREREEGEDAEMEEEKPERGGKLKDRIKHVLTEARVVLPGAQALMGFQLITFMTESFDKLPQSSKYVHFASLSLVAVSIVLLMTPAAYHRIVESGHDSEHFHRFASRLLVAAMAPLALGISGDFYVVARKVLDSAAYAAWAGAAALLLFYGLWYGLTAYRRAQRGPATRFAVEFSHD